MRELEESEGEVGLLEGDGLLLPPEELQDYTIPGFRQAESKKTKSLPSARVDLLFLKRFLRIMALSGTTPISLPHLYIWRLLLVSIMLGITSEMISEWVGMVGLLIAQKSYHSAWETIWRGLLLSIAFGVGKTFISFDINLLTWHWRKNITRDITQRYLTDTNPFSLVYLKEYAIDNPDQRIIDDVNQLCSNTATIVGNGFTCLATVVTVTIGMATKLGYIYVLVSYGLAILFGVFYILIMRPLARYSFQLDKVEGDFRYAHARIRDNSESIAFFHGGDKEQNNVNERLKEVITTSEKVTKWSVIFNIYNSLSKWVPSMGLTLSNAYILWFDSSLTPEYKFLTVITASQLGSLIMDQISSFLKLGYNLATVAGAVGRVAQLYEICDHLEENVDKRKSTFEYKDEISFYETSCDTPQGNVLVKNLNICIDPGTNVLIMGPSGSGKSSLLRSIAGLWKASGKITKPKHIGSELFFLPQMAYFVKGSLKDQIIYPHTTSTKTDEQLLECLEMANSEKILHLYGDWNVELEWSSVLSPGEQQRLLFARLFYHSPLFAVLDESTSALDTNNERQMYMQCKKLNITCLSVGHRYSLFEYHDKLLYFDGKEGYQFRDIDADDLKKVNVEKGWVIEKEMKGNFDLTKTIDLEEIPQPEKVVERALEERSYFTRVKYMLKIVHTKFIGRESGILLFIIVCNLASSLLQAYLPELTNKFIEAFLAADSNSFYLYSSLVVLVIIVLSLLYPGSFAGGSYLGIYYRKNMVDSIHKDYFEKDMFLFMNTMDNKVIDNVDQRISQECKESTTGWTSILQTVLSNSIVPIFLTVLLSNTTSQGKWLALMVWGYTIVFGVGSVVGTYVLSKYTIIQSIAEGNLRFAQIKIREYAESIVFNGTQSLDKEKAVLNILFDRVLHSYWDVIFYGLLLSLWNNVLSSCTMVFGSVFILVVMPDIFPVHSDAPISVVSGVHTSLMSYISSLLSTLTEIMSLSIVIGQHSGHLTRAVQFVDRMKKRALIESDRTANSTPAEVGDVIRVDNVIVTTPNGRQLNEHGITFSIDKNQNLIIMGPSGCGKSSLLRVLCGLWPASSGKIVRPKDQDLFFLPQKAYMLLGSLRDQIVYPRKAESCESDKEVIKALRLANLEYLLSRFELNTVEIWSSVLSGGEQQRLSMARLFFHKPSFAILDESTSALDPHNEELMYTRCSQLNITLISIAHRQSLTNYHQQMLSFDGNGGWTAYKKD